jgi:hypothetical protein
METTVFSAPLSVPMVSGLSPEDVDLFFSAGWIEKVIASVNAGGRARATVIPDGDSLPMLAGAARAEAAVTGVLQRTRRIGEKIARKDIFTAAEVLELLEKQRNGCAGCGEDISKSFTIDHIRPVRRGGWQSIHECRKATRRWGQFSAECRSRKQNSRVG